MKILSFVIPSYNAEQFLDKCIPSMLVPSLLSKLEVIVVNDGSKDNTAAVAEKYCKAYPDTVRLISQENKGHGGALNTGCAAAEGKYVKVIDADDWVVSENLPAYVEFLEQCESDVVLTHHHTIDISTGEIKNWKSYPPVFGKAYTWAEIMENWKSFDRSLTFHGITYRTAFYRAHGIALSEHVFYEDHEYATFPCCHAKSVTPVDLFLYEYRIGDVTQSVSNANQLRRLSHTETVLARMTAEYNKLAESEGKQYAAMKIRGLLMSYLTTTLLVHPDQSAGRQLAKRQIDRCKADAPAVYALVKRAYPVFVLLNLMHIDKRRFDRILNSKAYNTLRKNHTFD